MTKSQIEIANKGNYGIDAPNVIRNFLLIGTVLVIVAVLILLFVSDIAGLAIAMLISAIICFAEAILMIWSSKKGKEFVVKDLISKLHLSANDTVLDVGCGRGFVLNSLAKQLPQGKAVGVDIWSTTDQSGNSPEVTLQNAEIEGVKDRVEIINADARNLPFEANTFDAIASSLAIHNIYNKGERQKAIEEIVRVLKTGGRVAILDFEHVGEYAQVLRNSGLKDVTVSRLYFAMFPPVRIVTGIKE